MLVAGRNTAELERDTAVPARFSERRRLDGVQGDVFEPVGVEHDRRVFELLDRLDGEARLEEDPAAQLRRSRDFEASRRVLGRAHVHRLAEQVEERRAARTTASRATSTWRTIGRASRSARSRWCFSVSPCGTRHRFAFRRARGGFLRAPTSRSRRYRTQTDSDASESRLRRMPSQPVWRTLDVTARVTGSGSDQWTLVTALGYLRDAQASSSLSTSRRAACLNSARERSPRSTSTDIASLLETPSFLDRPIHFRSLLDDERAASPPHALLRPVASRVAISPADSSDHLPPLRSARRRPACTKKSPHRVVRVHWFIGHGRIKRP